MSSQEDDDREIYGEDLEPSTRHVHTDVDSEQKVGQSDAQKPLVTAQVSKLSWWITDEEIQSAVAGVGEIANLSLLQEEGNGRFNGTFEISIRTDEPESLVVERLKRLSFGDKEQLKVVIPKIAKPVVPQKVNTKAPPVQNSKMPKPAPMLYEDSKNPIPRNLLLSEARRGGDSDGDRKKSDRSKNDRKDRDRHRDRRDDRDRDWRHDKWDYDYDYDYESRRDKRSRRDEEDRYRDKRRK
jgi:hypothetical protein